MTVRGERGHPRVRRSRMRNLVGCWRVPLMTMTDDCCYHGMMNTVMMIKSAMGLWVGTIGWWGGGELGLLLLGRTSLC
eukprot:scaffold48767_cov67-Cyclotella_meneghiniana.AAC.2